MKEMWNEMPAILRKIILAELIVLCTMAFNWILISAAMADEPLLVQNGEPLTCVVHRGEWVWIRERPEKTARKIGRVRSGYEVDADGMLNNYLHIVVRPGWLLEGEDATVGYVDAQWFEKSAKETTYRVACEGKLAKREMPGGRMMCWIKPGVKISVIGWRYSEKGELWAKVFKGGYVKAEYLALN